MTAPSDAQLVSGVLAGDRDAFAQVYDRYADRLHDFAYAMLRHREDAADAVADAFVTSAERLEQLRDPERLRPWLYSVVRRECLRRLKARSRTSYTGDDELLDLPDAAAAPEVVAEQHALRSLVWDAAEGLNERDRAMLDLHLRQGLEGAELGEAMGMTADNAYVGLSRLRDQVERSIGALLVARTSSHDCEDLTGVLDDWDGEFTPLVRKRVARHVDRCGHCSRRRAALVSPAALLAGVPAFAAPVMLRERVLEDSRLVSALSSRGDGGGPPAGGPPGAGPPTRRDPRPGHRRTRVAAIATLVALVVALAGVVRWQQAQPAERRTVAEDTTGADTSTRPTPTDEASDPGQTTTQVTAELSPSVVPTLEVTATPSSSVTTSPTSEASASDEPSPTEQTSPSPSDDPTPTSTSTPSPGSLVASPSTLDLGTAGTGRITLRNVGGTEARFEVRPGAGWLAASPGTGVVKPGRTRTVTVTADRAALPEGPSQGGLTVAWDSGTVAVAVTAARETPPAIGGVTVVRSACGNGGRTVSVSVPVTDESGVASATVSWSGAGTSGSTALRLANGVWAGVIGPFPAGGTVTLQVTATDDRGNSGSQPASVDVDPCPQ